MMRDQSRKRQNKPTISGDKPTISGDKPTISGDKKAITPGKRGIGAPMTSPPSEPAP